MLIGREKEIAVLKEALESPKAEMIALVGRRRVGKTYLVEKVYEKQILFTQTGIRNATDAAMIKAFVDSVQKQIGYKIEKKEDWLDIFHGLESALKPLLKKDQKQVIFFDELSWLASSSSNFLDYLGYFWNSWANKQNLVLVLCGSASSWIIQNVINDRGGLHNRVTKHLHLKPFTLHEVELYFQSRHINFTRYEIVQMYMAFGGIPMYLEAVKGGTGAIQNINEICFSSTGLLRNEFNRLYPALFDDAEHHIAVIRALGARHTGMRQTDLAKATKLKNDTLTRILEELIQSDFVHSYYPLENKKRARVYRLMDEYSHFYLRFIENSPLEGEGSFLQLSQLPSFKIWSGYAYESVCMKHVPQIKKALGIGGVYTTTYSFFKRTTEDEKGVQIDMLLERADRVINLFEIKFYNKEFIVSKEYAKQLRERMERFQRFSKTKNYVLTTMITTFGLKHNMHSLGLIDPVLTLDDLF